MNTSISSEEFAFLLLKPVLDQNEDGLEIYSASIQEVPDSYLNRDRVCLFRSVFQTNIGQLERTLTIPERTVKLNQISTTSLNKWVKILLSELIYIYE